MMTGIYLDLHLLIQTVPITTLRLEKSETAIASYI